MGNSSGDMEHMIHIHLVKELLRDDWTFGELERCLWEGLRLQNSSAQIKQSIQGLHCNDIFCSLQTIAVAAQILCNVCPRSF